MSSVYAPTIVAEEVSSSEVTANVVTAEGDGSQIISTALVNLDATGIVTDGSGYVTAWNNSGTGGSDYDLDVDVGTLANSSVTTLNGINAVNSSGGYGLESTAGQTIASPVTVLAVARFSDATPSDNQVLFDSRSSSTQRMLVQTTFSNSDKFSIFQGDTVLSLSESYDTDAHVISARFNGDSSTSLDFSSVGNVVGDSGSDDWDYGTIFNNFSEDKPMVGYIAQFLVFDRALNETEIQAVQAYLASKFAL